MDGLITILIVWGVISLVGNAVKKSKTTAKVSKRDEDEKPIEKPKPAPVKPSVWEQINMMNTAMMEETEDKSVLPDGIGEGLAKPGSIALAAAENMDYDSNKAYSSDDSLGDVKHSTVGRVNTGDMRKAVIMSEILSRPVAMRRQSGGVQRRRCGA